MSTRDTFINHKANLARAAQLSEDVPIESSAQGTGTPNRHGMPKLPPGESGERLPV